MEDTFTQRLIDAALHWEEEMSKWMNDKTKDADRMLWLSSTLMATVQQYRKHVLGVQGRNGEKRG